MSTFNITLSLQSPERRLPWDLREKVCGDFDIGFIKVLAYVRFSVPESYQDVSFQDRILEDAILLSDFDVGEGDVLKIYVKGFEGN